MTTEYKPSLLQRRPTETASPVIIAAAALIARAVGTTDPDTLTYMIILLGFVPTAVTWLVDTWRHGL
jgi:hypothetical protein